MGSQGEFQKQVTMGRMHSKGKGIARRSLPYKRTPPSWVKQSAQDTVKEICNMAKKGYTPSNIGVVLRDSHGIPQVKMIAGNKIVRILRAQGLAPALPEDLHCLIKKAVAVRKHLEKNQGQGLQVSSDPYRVPHPPSRSVLPPR